MTADTIATAIIAGAAYAIGAAVNIWLQRRKFSAEIGDLHFANTDLRDRLATVQGQLSDERARYALRVNRAHEGACKAARTRKAMRIRLPEAMT